MWVYWRVIRWKKDLCKLDLFFSKHIRHCWASICKLWMNNGPRGARRLGQFLETILTVSMKRNLKNDEHDEIAEWVHWWEANDRNSNMAAGHGKATIERLELVEIVFQKPGDGAWLLPNIEESWPLPRQFTCEPLVQKKIHEISTNPKKSSKEVFKRGPFPTLDYYSHPNFSLKETCF